MKNIYIYTIEGNIGSGKSTIIKEIKKKYNSLNNCEIIYLPEPVDIWSSIKDENGINIIKKFYADNNKYSFPFQMMAYISRITQLRKIKHNLNPHKTYVFITERSVHTDKNVFAKMLFEEKKMNYCEYQIYNKWFDEFIQDIPIHKYIYIDTDTKVCMERIKKRSRKGEELIPIKYLNDCKKYHDNWLNELETDILIMSGDGEINTPEYNETIKNIINFISENTPNNFTSTSEVTMDMLMNHPFF